MRRSDRRGAALILVLALLITLGLIAADVGRATRLDATIIDNVRSRTVARYAAESGVVAAAARVQALLDGAASPSERATALADIGARLASLRDRSVGDARFDVSVTDLNARIDLNHSDPDIIQGLLRQFTTEQEARVIVASLAATPLERVGEFAALPGVTDALALAVAPYVTVWSDGLVNITSAPAPVLAALRGLTGDGTSASLPVLAVTEPSRLLIIARGWREGSPLTHEIQSVYSIDGGRLVLRVWQERDL